MGKKGACYVLFGVIAFVLVAYGTFRYTYTRPGTVPDAKVATDAPVSPVVEGTSGPAPPSPGLSPAAPSTLNPAPPPAAVPLPRSLSRAAALTVPPAAKQVKEEAKRRRYEWAAAQGKLAEVQEADRVREEKKAKREAVRKERKEASDNRRELRRQLAERRKAGERTLPPSTVLREKKVSAPPATN